MMLKPSVVMSAYKPKTQQTKRKISFRQTGMRWVALILGCLVCFGWQYCFDNPSALQQPLEVNLKPQNPNIESDFMWLYSIYSIPNILIPLIGGLMIDKLGARVIMVVTAGICCLGQAVFFSGGYKNLFWLMLVGRGIFGVGGESLMASQNTLLSNWFQPQQLSLVLGICISFPKLGSALNSYVSPKISEHYAQHPVPLTNSAQESYEDIYVPLLVGLAIMLISFLLSLVLFYLDSQSDRREKRHHQTQILTNKQQPSIKIDKKRRVGSVMSSKLGSQIKVQETESNIREGIEQGGQEDAGGHGDGISLKDITKLPLTFWLLIIVCMLSQALFIPFLDNGNKYFSRMYNITPVQAGNYLVLPYLFCALLCPFLGIVIDKIKWRSIVIIFSCFMFTLTYGVMMFLEYQNVSAGFIAIPVALLGICCALFCTAIVPSVPMIVQPKLFGTAFGIMQMLQNLALAVFPQMASQIKNAVVSQTQGFNRQTIFYFSVSVICLLFAIVLAVNDRCKGNKMMHKNFRKDYVKTVLEPEGDEYKALAEN